MIFIAVFAKSEGNSCVPQNCHPAVSLKKRSKEEERERLR
jgi:hypothetical protein